MTIHHLCSIQNLKVNRGTKAASWVLQSELNLQLALGLISLIIDGHQVIEKPFIVDLGGGSFEKIICKCACTILHTKHDSDCNDNLQN